MSPFEAWHTHGPDSLPQSMILGEVQRLKSIIVGNATWVAEGAAWWGKRKSGEEGYEMNLLATVSMMAQSALRFFWRRSIR